MDFQHNLECIYRMQLLYFQSILHLFRMGMDYMAGLRNLVMAYEDLLGWMEECEARLASYKVLSVFTKKN